MVLTIYYDLAIFATFGTIVAMTPVALPSSDERYALLLRLWEAINAERELPSVLATLGSVLVPFVPLSGIAIIQLVPEQPELDRLLAMYAVGHPQREGESTEDFAERLKPLSKPLPATRALLPYPSIADWDFATVNPTVCDDLLEREGWYEHEFQLAASGVRSYVAVPMVVTRKVIGTAVFTRLEQRAFPPEDVALLKDVVRALTVATANAIANEEIRKLRDQLAAENISLREQLGQAPWFGDIVANSALLKHVLEKVEQVGGTDATVLITGETGTGKELIARALHRRSARARGPLVRVNCAAIPESLLASELFGHERGAFTGAVERRKGRFEQAHGGTLFLDEIGELSPEMQVLLLRVLQEHEFERLGGSQTLRVDVRLITATNRDLAAEVRQGNFRKDLFYRLNVFPLHIPPLRQRPEDIPPLVAHLVEKHSARFGQTITRIDRRSLDRLQAYSWPGNVRELENVVERAIIVARSGVLSVDADMLDSSSGFTDPKTAVSTVDQSHSQERAAILAALEKARGKISGERGAAKQLGVPASTLEFRIKKLGIDKFCYRGILTSQREQH